MVGSISSRAWKGFVNDMNNIMVRTRRWDIMDAHACK